MAVIAAKELNLGVEVGYSDDIQKGLAMAVMQFPVLAINGKPVLTGATDMAKVKKALRDQSGGSDVLGGCPCGGGCADL